MSSSSSTGTTHFKFLNDPGMLSRRHLRFGWWTLLVFVVLGLVLEGLHAFKVEGYLGAKQDARRLMWTLAHAHGTLFAAINVLFALTVRMLPEWAARERGIASGCLRAATLLTPAGFFLGGVRIYAGDPGVGIILVPVGALLMILAVFLVACGTGTIRVEARANSANNRAAPPARGERPG